MHTQHTYIHTHSQKELNNNFRNLKLETNSKCNEKRNDHKNGNKKGLGINARHSIVFFIKIIIIYSENVAPVSIVASKNQRETKKILS